MSTPDRSDELDALARAIAMHRVSSVIILEITRLDDARGFYCEDVAALAETDGRVLVLTAMVAALEKMLEHARLTLRAELSSQETKH